MKKILIVITLALIGLSNTASTSSYSVPYSVNFKSLSYGLKTGVPRGLVFSDPSFEGMSTRPFGVPITSTLEYKCNKYQKLKVSKD